MPFLVAPELVEPVTRSLLGAIDVDGGPTDEQLAVLRAVVTHLWERPDLDLAALAPARPARRGHAPSKTRTPAADSTRCWSRSSSAAIPQTEAQVDARRGVRARHGRRRSAPRHLPQLDRRGHRARHRGLRPLLRRGPPAGLRALAARPRTCTSTSPTPTSRERLEALHDLPEDTLGWHVHRVLPAQRHHRPRPATRTPRRTTSATT